ncbi:hypothetical protein PVAP13_1KG196805 [Panicum virgatum]|uniref:Uncharacterized protein n=1 Tax=Panicum virgatum TaxID=38727 RepID=A0A8T0X7U1_PANVG|nr:hypothetical protein PVAP13_1KG196805 [Panicum virgatum]KAG2657701.1 hypothetical protein PVAP13_1KG196805 [Panicum virgatum]
MASSAGWTRRSLQAGWRHGLQAGRRRGSSRWSGGAGSSRGQRQAEWVWPASRGPAAQGGRGRRTPSVEATVQGSGWIEREDYLNISMGNMDWKQGHSYLQNCSVQT